MTQPRAGFLLTRHWRDTPQGTELSFWLATDHRSEVHTSELQSPFVISYAL
ncbi:hypothetical protein ACHWGW_05630, partial [Klebsiella pneumoniae]